MLFDILADIPVYLANGKAAIRQPRRQFRRVISAYEVVAGIVVVLDALSLEDILVQALKTGLLTSFESIAAARISLCACLNLFL